MTSKTWFDAKVHYINNYYGLFRRSHFKMMLLSAKKQCEKEKDNLINNLIRANMKEIKKCDFCKRLNSVCGEHYTIKKYLAEVKEARR